MKDIEFTPAIAGLAYDDIYIDTFDGERLNAWFIPGEDSMYTILFCHGNGGNISHRIDKIEILHELGFDIFIFDYRGYGKSSGRPSEKGFYKDVQAAYDYLVDEKGYQLAFFLNPTHVEDIIAIASKLEKMPQKSTFFYPKLPTGLVLNGLE